MNERDYEIIKLVFEFIIQIGAIALFIVLLAFLLAFIMMLALAL